jgi:parvulin-like peptidyl-prolyl isomerase
VGMLVIVIVSAIIGYGFYATSFAQGREHVTTVGDQVFNWNDYADALHLCQLGLCQLDFGPSSGDEREDPIIFLEKTELITLGAIEANTSITDDEVTQEIRLLLEEGGEPLTDEEFQELYQEVLSNVGLSDGEFREVVATQLLQTKLSEDFVGQVPQSGEQVRTEAIPVTTEEEAAAVMGNLSKGEDFTSLADEYGGGELGWLPRGIVGEGFDQVAFNISIGEVSDPFPSNTGYLIIRVLDREEDRAFEKEVREQLAVNAYSDWLQGEIEEKVERNPKYVQENPEYINNLLDLYEWALDQIS